MIVTLTLNPALDKTVEVDCLQLGRLNRLQNVRIDAGGKGINVSKMIQSLGGQSLATGFVGGESGEELLRRLAKIEIVTDFVTVNGKTRTNMKVLDKQNGITELNEPGAFITEHEAEVLREKLVKLAGPKTLFILSGSLPCGLKTTFYQTLIHDIKKKEAKIFLDADGEAFCQALEAKPNYIKPNREELAQYFQVSENISLLEMKKLCLKLIEKGIELVALSMGSDGVMFVTSQNTFYGKGLKVPVSSTVGAGDSMVGALAYAMEQGMSQEEVMRLSIAASAGAVMTEGTNPPIFELVEQLKQQVQLEEI